MHNLPRLNLLYLLLAIACTPAIKLLASCPFCTAVSQTLRQEMSQTDVVVFANFVQADSDSIATFQVQKVLKGSSLIQVGDKVSTTFFGKPAEEQTFLLMGIGPTDILWSSPLRVNDKIQAYVDQVNQLPANNASVRLKFYLSQLADNDPIIARDVFDEFASASYTEMIELKDHYDRPQLLRWIQDKSVSLERYKLYMVMLGICGQKEDSDILEKLVRSDDPDRQSGLDALIACFLTLRGQSGLPLIEEKFLANKQANYAEIYATIMALRFHGTDGKVIDSKVLAKSLSLILDRPKLADLVIPDLARWEDWSHINTIVTLFKESEKNDATWLRVPAIQYLRACPLPEAAKALEELKQLDPAAYKRATQFFPQPSVGESSHLMKPSPSPALVRGELQLASVGGMDSDLSFFGAKLRTDEPNQVNSLSLAGVLGSSVATLWLGMWLTLTGAGIRRRWVVPFMSRH